MNIPACPSVACSLPPSGPVVRHVVRAGYYRRKNGRQRIQRFRCKICRLNFSVQTLDPTYHHKKPDLNSLIMELLSSQVSQRRCARILQISHKTVVRKFRFMARRAALCNEQRRAELNGSVLEIQFDDLVTSIHTKCKPASVSLAVISKTREILGIQVSDIPARYPLTERSIKKYGSRFDERPIALGRLFNSLREVATKETIFRSDSDMEYVKHVQRHFKIHEQVKARKAHSAGFGELKCGAFDPIYSLNHTCAMLRANINRLARKTWCTSKTKVGLLMHLELYAHYHNSQLLVQNAI